VDNASRLVCTEQTSPNKRRRLNPTTSQFGTLIVISYYKVVSIHLLYCLHYLASNTTNQNVLAGQALLNAEFRSYREAAAEFPPTISPATICSAIASFKQALESHAHRSVCGIFCESRTIKKLRGDENHFQRLKDAELDKCGYESGY
jgi:hypothetical protein